jgi:glucokinase
MNDDPDLVADIGGTNARFALADGLKIRDVAYLRVRDHADPAAAVRYYLAGVPARPRRACLAVAGPVMDGDIPMTNSDWRFDRRKLAAELGLERLVLINDFEAQALALPHLGESDLLAMGGGRAIDTAMRMVVGAGTGFGVAGLLRNGTGWRALSSEGGNMAWAPLGPRERAVHEVFLDKLIGDGRHRVMCEDILSGVGLRRLYLALSALESLANDGLSEPEIIARARSRSCTICAEAIDLFGAVLGATAGDMALVMGARGGVYVTGGVVAGLADLLPASRFRARFEEKGQVAHYAAAIPTWLVTAANTGLLGAAARLNV